MKPQKQVNNSFLRTRTSNNVDVSFRVRWSSGRWSWVHSSNSIMDYVREDTLSFPIIVLLITVPYATNKPKKRQDTSQSTNSTYGNYRDTWAKTRMLRTNIDYYMLRARYRFYSQVFNTISRTSESSSYISHATSWEVFLTVFLFSFSLRNSEISSLRHSQILKWPFR